MLVSIIFKLTASKDLLERPSTTLPLYSVKSLYPITDTKKNSANKSENAPKPDFNTTRVIIFSYLIM